MVVMNGNFSEKKIFLLWAAFFGLMFVPFAVATEFWSAIIEDEDAADVLAFVFFAATSYFAFRLIVRKMTAGKQNETERKEV